MKSWLFHCHFQTIEHRAWSIEHGTSSPMANVLNDQLIKVIAAWKCFSPFFSLFEKKRKEMKRQDMKRKEKNKNKKEENHIA